MTKKETIKEQLAVLRTENNYQTTAIGELKTMLITHNSASEAFRDKCLKNETDIKWMKRIALFVVSGGGLLTIGWNYIKTKLGG